MILQTKKMLINRFTTPKYYHKHIQGEVDKIHIGPNLYVHVLSLKDPGRSKYNHTSMESLVDVEYKYIRVNIVFPFHKLQDAERTSHCPPPPSYVTYLVRLAETLMT